MNSTTQPVTDTQAKACSCTDCRCVECRCGGDSVCGCQKAAPAR